MENSLQHVGVLGMRWGRRKSSSDSGPAHDDHTSAHNLKSKKLYQMSNAEIRTLATRMQLEKQYKDLNPDSKTRGKKRVEGTLKTIATFTTGAATIVAAAKMGEKICNYALKPESIDFAAKVLAKATLAAEKVIKR